MRRVLIKADDFRVFPSSLWNEFICLCAEHELPVTLGLIGKSLESRSVSNDLITMVADSQYVEVWNHGYEHSGLPGAKHQSEFYRTSAESQLSAIERTQVLAQEAFGCSLRAFGAPFNKFDAVTLQCLRKFSEIHYLFDIGYLPGFKTIPCGLYVECDGSAAGNRFNFEVAQKRSLPFLKRDSGFVLQIHPGNHWEGSSLKSFKRFVFFCKDEGCEFSNIEEFYEASFVSDANVDS